MGIGGDLELIDSWDRETGIIESYIKARAVAGQVLQILEAGCGNKWRLNLDGVDFYLTGVDLDKAALEIRKTTRNDLHEIVEGDLRFVQLQKNQYDVIYNSFVLEHINGAEQVLKNLTTWIKPAGIIIILIPDPISVAGFITRITPHWFHVFHYRCILGVRNAGKPGYAPYPVVYDPIVSRGGMRDFCSRNGLAILAEYGDGYVRPGRGAMRPLIHCFKKLVSVLSLGRLSARHTNLLYVLQKRPAV